MIVVLDTNVFIDALFDINKDCKLILKREYNGEFSIIMSNLMNEELINILERTMSKIETDEETNAKIYKILLRAMRRIKPIEPTTKFTKCEDYSDNMFFECAIDGNADYLISRDAHIHKVKEESIIKNSSGKQIQIMYPDEFVNELDKIKLSLHFTGISV